MSSHKRKFARKHRLREPHRILEETGLLESREVIVHETGPGMRKMSETLLEFLEPYRELADTDEATERLIALGALAWNLALRSADERERELRELAATVFRNDPAVAMQMIEEMIERRRRHFTDDRRLIASYTITPSPDELRLVVASTRLPPT